MADELKDDDKVLGENDNEQSTPNLFAETLRLMFIALAIVLPIRMFVVAPFIVEGASMEPGYHNAEYLLVDEISYRFQEPTRGEVVVFRPPDNQSIFYIKRIVGMPGETVMIKDKKITIVNKNNPDGFILNEEPYVLNQSASESEFSKVSLKDNEYFVMGDNRENSRDSRILGPIGKDYVKGKVMLRVFPFNKLSITQKPEYGINDTANLNN